MSTIQNQSAGGIWVKAVDRTPIKEGDLVAIRYGINYQFMGTAYFESGAWYEPNGNLLFKSPFNVIWLDESTSSPAEQQIANYAPY